MSPSRGVNFRPLRSICRLTLANGLTGYGEGDLNQKALKRVVGQSAPDLVWDDSLGSGLQMALFDAVGKTRELPIHRLLGVKQRDRTPVAWTSYSMPGTDWKRECEEAILLGYTCFRGKARPWFDLQRQLQALRSTCRKNFAIGFDFNSWLMDYRHAEPYVERLSSDDRIYMFEEPLPPGDFPGNRRLRRKTRAAIVLHCGHDPVDLALEEEICDGFVVGGGACQVMEYGRRLAAADKPFFLEIIGSGLAATYCTHFGAVLSHATLPAVNLNHMFTEQLIRPEIRVQNGVVAVPEGPGLGVAVDENALERYRVDPDRARRSPSSKHLYAIRWSSRAVSYYATVQKSQADFLLRRIPIFSPGVFMEEIPSDGSKEWADLQARASNGGVHEGNIPI